MRTSGTSRLAALLLSVAVGTDAFGSSTIEFARPTAATIVTVAENVGDAVLTVLRTGDLEGVVTVDFTTADGTAKAGSDYDAGAGTLSFGADEKLRLVVIGVLNDGQREVGETFTFGLANPTEGAALGTVKSATITITDNDPGVHLDRSQYWIAEDEGALVVEARRGNDPNREAFTVMGPW